MAQIFNLQHSQAHRAIEDAKATSELFLKYLNIFQGKGLRKINQLYYPRNHFELDQIHFDKEDSQLSDIEKMMSLESRPIYIVVKGENGVILTALPIESPKDSTQDIISFLEKINWKLITIKLIGPMTEGLLHLNEDILKIPEPYRKQTLDYLYKIIPSNKPVQNQFDFVVTSHLIQGQLIIYPMSNLSNYQKLIFKYPAHKKKLTNYLNGHIQKGNEDIPRKKFMLNEQIHPLFYNYIANMWDKKNDTFIYCLKGELSKGTKEFFHQLEIMVKHNSDRYSFPKTHY